MLNFNSERVSSIALIIVSLLCYPTINKLGELSKTFPLTVVTALLVFSIILLFKSFVKPIKTSFFEHKNQFVALGLFFLGFVAYIFFVWLIGFVISSLIYLPLSSYLLKADKNTKHSVLSSILIGLIVFVVFYGTFHYIFAVPLPEGMLFGG